MAESPRLSLSGVVLGARQPRELADFYVRLLGWSVEQDEPGWVKLRAPEGGPGLSFQAEPEHIPPSWPPQPGAQQMMVHLDIKVDDLEAASRHALAAGARLADFQPQAHVRVFFDPAGHPFCLFV